MEKELRCVELKGREGQGEKSEELKGKKKQWEGRILS